MESQNNTITTGFKQIATHEGHPVLWRLPKPGQMDVRFPFDRKLIERAKAMGLSWKEKDKVWRGDLNVMSAWQMGRLFPEAKPEILGMGILPETSWNGWIPSEYLMEHQKRGAEIAEKRNRFCYWHQTGTGKGCLGIELYKQKHVKTLTVCPLSIIEGAWLEDIRKFAPEIKAVNLWRLARNRNSRMGKAAFERGLADCQIAIVNFDTFKTLRPELETRGFRMLIVDESSFVKNPKAAVTKEVAKFADRMWYVYLMSGTPAPNSEAEYFSQMRMVDPFLFGRNFYLFRQEWFRTVDFAGFKWALKPELKEEFRKRIARVSDFVDKHEVLDLPERTFNVRKVYLSKEEDKAYREMARKMVTEIEEQEIEAANAAVKAMKLREITSGFLLDEEAKVSRFGTTKMRELEALLEEIGKRQVIIWIQFKQEAAWIKELLVDRAVVCNSTVSTICQIDNIQNFKDKKVQYLIAHPKSVGHGHTLTNASDAIYFSLSYSYEQQTQSQDRLYRKGQKNACSYYFILADDTIDEVIYRTLYSKEARLEETLGHLKRFK